MEDERPAKRAKVTPFSKRPPEQDQQSRRKNTKIAHAKAKANISASGIHNDNVGIFVTSDKGQERRCLAEMHDLLTQYLEQETSSFDQGKPSSDGKEGFDDVEADIEAELRTLKSPNKAGEKIELVMLDIPCVSFVRLNQRTDPVDLVHKICSDAFSKRDQKRCRYIKRMTPMTLMRKTLSGGLEELCERVLPPHFHSGGPAKRFAIKPTIRNNHQFEREMVIRTVAKAVGHEHKVDLKGYDCLILVDVYRNVCGMSVVSNDYEKFKRYNLAEIYQPTQGPPRQPIASKELAKEADKLQET